MLLSTIYITLAFSYSILGFFNGLPHGNGSEYTISFLIPELSGHVLFAALAVLPFMDWQLIILSSVVAVFIDTDHLLGIFTTLPFIGRPDHSILFILVSTAVLVYAAGRMNLSTSSQIKIAFVVPIAILSHLSFDVLAAYDIFGGGSFTFPLFYPFIASLVSFPLYSFVLLEASGISLAVVGRKVVNKYGKGIRGKRTPFSKPETSI